MNKEMLLMILVSLLEDLRENKIEFEGFTTTQNEQTGDLTIQWKQVKPVEFKSGNMFSANIVLDPVEEFQIDPDSVVRYSNFLGT